MKDQDVRAARSPLLRRLDAVTLAVPDVDHGLAFYVDTLGHQLLWRRDDIGQAGLGCPETATEIVLATTLPSEPTWLVDSAEVAVYAFVKGGGRVIAAPRDIDVGRVAVVEDPFGNRVTVIDLSQGRYVTDDAGHVLGVEGSDRP